MNDTAQFVASTDALLALRPCRPADHQAENLALRQLADELGCGGDGILQTLCEFVRSRLGAGSAGISLLTSPDGTEFYWPVIVGAWAEMAGGTVERSTAPCQMVLQHNRPLLFQNPKELNPDVPTPSPPVEEMLLVPFRIGGKPVGTLWALAHPGDRQFDREDLRLLESLAQFAGATYQLRDAEAVARRASDQLELLNIELGHRLKNMLTMVMAVAQQTLKHVDERSAVDAFQKRLRALGAAHDALVDQEWSAALVRTIAERACAFLGEDGRVSFAGPNINLGPRSALSLALIIHELVTNAIKYGALSQPGGTVRFTWRVVGAEDSPVLQMTWAETGGPAVIAPTAKGFGTRLMSMGLLGRGDVTLSFDPDGLKAHFEAPLDLAQAATSEEKRIAA